MTDVGRAVVGDQITEAAVDGLSKTYDCTIGKANLLKGNGIPIPDPPPKSPIIMGSKLSLE